MEPVKDCRKIEARLLSVIEAILPRSNGRRRSLVRRIPGQKRTLDPNGKFAVVVQAFGFETQEAAVAGAEQNAEWSLKDFR